MEDAHLLTIALLTLGDPDRLTGGNRYHRRVAQLAPRHGARMEIVGVPSRPLPTVPWRVRAALARIEASRPDCLLLDSLAATVAAPWLLRPPRVPLLAILHQQPGGIDHGALGTAWRAPVDRLAYRHALRLVAASAALADSLVRLGVAPPHLVRTVPPGRDPVEPEPGPPRDPRNGARCAVLCAANWLPRKGVLDLLEAVARLPEGSVTLHLAGDTAVDRHQGRRVWRRLAMPDLRRRVVVHGPMTQARLAALYRDVDVFALASRSEPYGTVYGEAMSWGLPVVGWRAGNLVHLADDGVEGVLVETGDINALANALHRLARDVTLRGRMGTAARARAMRLPTWDQTTAALVAVVREALDGPRPPAASHPSAGTVPRRGTS